MALDESRVLEFLNSQHYLRPVIRTHPLACEVCGGTKGGTQYARCFKCSYNAKYLPPRLGFGFYARIDAQDGYAMRGYKSAAMGGLSTHRSIVGCMIYLGITEYQRRWGADIVTSVPSLSGRQGQHPLASLTCSASDKVRNGPKFESIVSAGKEIGDPRSIAPHHFAVTGDVSGKEVLLVEDTWTTGGHVLSAAEALRLHGANVAIFAVARWLNTDGDYGGNELYAAAGESSTGFGDVCLFSAI